MIEQESLSTPAKDDATRVRIADFRDLYTRPRLFFKKLFDADKKPFLLLVVWSLGVSAQFDRVDAEIMRADAGAPGNLWGLLQPIVTDGWVGYWLWTLGIGVISGAILYLIGGWWYRVRLWFSGVSDPDVDQARLVYCYASFVASLPHLLVAIVLTAAYPSYYASFQSDELLSSSLIFFLFWSIAVSYSGATSVFPVTLWKARIWFLALPVVFYTVLMGGLVWLLTFLR